MKRPRIIINCAMSADGKIALPSKKQMRISCQEDIKRMYELRHNCDAVLVGIETILSDDPKLTVKESYVKNPKQPLRVVLDSQGRIPEDALVLNTTAHTLIFTVKGNEKQYEGNHVEVVGCPQDDDGHVELKYALTFLWKKQVKTLLVEGGGTVIWKFVRQRFVDDFFVYLGPFIIGGRRTPTMANGVGIRNENEAIALRIVEVSQLGPGILIHYQLR
jgi:2,5-diamino-6-(ribosylamino)-4(3H)-pyrimidinone 5'-phosphate reductase